MSPNADEFVIITSGLVTNEPSVPVFDLDILKPDNQKPKEIGDLYRRLYEFAEHLLGHERICLDVLPDSLAQAIRETETALASGQNKAVDREILILARNDKGLRDALIDAVVDPLFLGTRLAEILAARALGTLGIAVRDDQRVLLTDREQHTTEQMIAITPAQLLAAIDQYRLITGDELDLEAIEAALYWT